MYSAALLPKKVNQWKLPQSLYPANLRGGNRGSLRVIIWQVIGVHKDGTFLGLREWSGKNPLKSKPWCPNGKRAGYWSFIPPKYRDDRFCPVPMLR